MIRYSIVFKLSQAHFYAKYKVGLSVNFTSSVITVLEFLNKIQLLVAFGTFIMANRFVPQCNHYSGNTQNFLNSSQKTT